MKRFSAVVLCGFLTLTSAGTVHAQGLNNFLNQGLNALQQLQQQQQQPAQQQPAQQQPAQQQPAQQQPDQPQPQPVQPQQQQQVQPKPDVAPRIVVRDVNQKKFSKSNLNVRSQPSSSGAKLGRLSEGQEVTVIGLVEENGQIGVWRKISYGTGSGYVHGDYLRDESATNVAVNSAQPEPQQQVQPQQTSSPSQGSANPAIAAPASSSVEGQIFEFNLACSDHGLDNLFLTVIKSENYNKIIVKNDKKSREYNSDYVSYKENIITYRSDQGRKVQIHLPTGQTSVNGSLVTMKCFDSKSQNKEQEAKYYETRKLESEIESSFVGGNNEKDCEISLNQFSKFTKQLGARSLQNTTDTWQTNYLPLYWANVAGGGSQEMDYCGRDAEVSKKIPEEYEIVVQNKYGTSTYGLIKTNEKERAKLSVAGELGYNKGEMRVANPDMNQYPPLYVEYIVFERSAVNGGGKQCRSVRFSDRKFRSFKPLDIIDPKTPIKNTNVLMVGGLMFVVEFPNGKKVFVRKSAQSNSFFSRPAGDVAMWERNFYDSFDEKFDYEGFFQEVISMGDSRNEYGFVDKIQRGSRDGSVFELCRNAFAELRNKVAGANRKGYK